MESSLILSAGGRRYGRKEPPPLPHHMMLARRTSGLPAVIDLRAWAGPIKDQGDEGSCTAHAGSSAREWISRKYFGKQPIQSPQFLYARELDAQGSFPDDDGL